MSGKLVIPQPAHGPHSSSLKGLPPLEQKSPLLAWQSPQRPLPERFDQLHTRGQGFRARAEPLEPPSSSAFVAFPLVTFGPISPAVSTDAPALCKIRDRSNASNGAPAPPETSEVSAGAWAVTRVPGSCQVVASSSGLSRGAGRSVKSASNKPSPAVPMQPNLIQLCFPHSWRSCSSGYKIGSVPNGMSSLNNRGHSKVP